ncbi:acyl carrier protein [Streptomyces sp. NPDC006372]|uniref:acyl carrier protein n=1 Tax=Streptomyces sp. NPDC006372 TaxID=3155599 RepID=UPI0033BC4DB6
MSTNSHHTHAESAHNEVLRRIADHVRAELDLGPRTAIADTELHEADLFDLGLTSRTALALLAWTKEEFGATISLRTLIGDPYIRVLAEEIAEATIGGEPGA